MSSPSRYARLGSNVEDIGDVLEMTQGFYRGDVSKLDTGGRSLFSSYLQSFVICLITNKRPREKIMSPLTLG